MINKKEIKGKNITGEIFSLRGIVKVGMLSAIAFILMLLEFPLPLFPAFLKFDISDLPALIGGFALGPLAAVLIEFIKNVFHFIFKPGSTGGSGNLANFIVGAAFTAPAAYIYLKNKSKKGALIGMGVGTVFLLLVSSLANYYILIPLYAKLYSMEVVMALMTQIKYIVDIKSYVIYAVLPFNLIKAVVISLITLFIYKSVSPILRK